jgi:hypothetical protein
MAKVFSEGNPAPKPRIVTRPSVPVEKPAPPPIYLIQVYNGAKHTEEKFSDLEHQ